LVASTALTTQLLIKMMIQRYNLIFLLLLFINSAFVLGQNKYELTFDTTYSDSGFCVKKDLTFFNENYEFVYQANDCRCFYNNGILERECSYVNGYLSGYSYYYYDNGSLRKIFRTIKGRKVGDYLEYYSDGNVKVIGRYKDIECLSEIQLECDTIILYDEEFGEEIIREDCDVKSIKIGTWFYYDNWGNVVDSVIYKEE